MPQAAPKAGAFFFFLRCALGPPERRGAPLARVLRWHARVRVVTRAELRKGPDRRGGGAADPGGRPLPSARRSCAEGAGQPRARCRTGGARRGIDANDGTLDLVAFIKVHDPDVIVYDLPRPYENHWNCLRLMKETTSLKDRLWILTTTDKEALEAAVGASDVVEIIVGQPYGADDVVEAVHAALGSLAPE